MAKETVNPNHKLMCCVGCGRDTKSAHGYCRGCYTQGSVSHKETKDRRCVSTSRQYGPDFHLDSSVRDNR